MNIYAFDGGEIDWVAAETKKEAIEHYMNENGLSKNDLKDYKVRRLSKSERSIYKIVDMDGIRDENGDYPVVSNFEEAIKGLTSPMIIATTAY